MIIKKLTITITKMILITRLSLVGWCVAVQTTMNNRTQLVFDALLNRKPVAIAQQGGHVITSG